MQQFCNKGSNQIGNIGCKFLSRTNCHKITKLLLSLKIINQMKTALEVKDLIIYLNVIGNKFKNWEWVNELL